MREKIIIGIHAMILLISGLARAQYLANTDPSATNPVFSEIKGIVVDAESQTPLLYASIYVLHRNIGVISNENGYFSIEIPGRIDKDTLRIQYIGYETRNIPVNVLDTFTVINLKEKIYDLNEALVFGNAPDAAFIVKMVLKNKESNYKRTTSLRQTFIRERDIADFESLKLNYKKSTIPELDRETLKKLEENIPKQTTSFNDFLGNIYHTKDPDDSAGLKIDPVRKEIEDQQYIEFRQPENVNLIMVDQFDDELWSGYPIIEPTKQMKEYKKR